MQVSQTRSLVEFGMGFGVLLPAPIGDFGGLVNKDISFRFSGLL